MKIVLEFKNRIEHDKYVEETAQILRGEITIGEQKLSVSNFKGVPIETYTRRKTWSQLELEFLVEHYKTKKIPWIAKQLRRKPTQLYQQLNKMYKKGLPKKAHKNGKIKE